ncbi:uncharacterized protein LOC110855672 [Folsomia candida]|nr:uncharacterized protein LOC110855672 [Folsomia candida]
MESSNPSNTSDMVNPQLPSKLPKLEDDDKIKPKLLQYLDQFSTDVRSGKFVTEFKMQNIPTIELKVIETGELLKFPLPPVPIEIEELAASELEIINIQDWLKVEEAIPPGVKDKFGLDSYQISVSLQKLLIQTPGDRFPPNLDDFCNQPNEESLTKKRFGHLVIQLPSLYTGGDFCFTHEDESQIYDLSTANGNVTCLIFFTKIEHAHCEILTGIRSCLIYNLVVESNESDFKLPQAPTLKNIAPPLSQIILEWRLSPNPPRLLILKGAHKKLTFSGINGLANTLGPILRANGVTLFHGTFAQIGASLQEFEIDAIPYIRQIKLLASPDILVENAFSSFYSNERINLDDSDSDSEDDRGLNFDLAIDQREQDDDCDVDIYLFFRSSDTPGGEGEDIFENEGWVKDFEFWRFHSHLFLMRCHYSVDSSELFHAAKSLLSLDIHEESDEGDDCFQNFAHFKELLDIYMMLEDSEILQEFLQLCVQKSDFNVLFGILLKSGVEMGMLKASLREFFDLQGTQSEDDFHRKIEKYCLHIRSFDFSVDKDREKIYFDAFSALLEKYKELQNADKFSAKTEIAVVTEFFKISEVWKYNMLNFVGSRSPEFAKQVLFYCTCNSLGGLEAGWVRFVTELYCSTKLLENWINEGEHGPEEETFLYIFFMIVEKVGADIRGLLSDVRRYKRLVRVLSHLANSQNVGNPEGENEGKKPGVLGKFWVPFATSLKARIEAVLYSDEDNEYHEYYERVSNKSEASGELVLGTDTLDEINKLLNIVEND